ncbi:MAG: hypothetical protein ACM358_15130 [Gemmatimonadota bacterium]
MSGRLALVEERVEVEGFGLERFSGVGLGLEVERRLGARFTLGLHGQGATMEPDASGDLDRRIGEAEFRALLSVTPSWGFYGGLTLRAIANDAGRQRWLLGRIGAELRPAFTGDRFRAIGRLGVIPISSVDGLSPSALAFDGAVGLAYQQDRWALKLVYGLERFAFTSSTGVRRDEQLSTLTFRAGIRR